MRLNGKIVHNAQLATLVGTGVGLRLASVPPSLTDLDAVNFARSLSTFDLAAQSPHFPGYPVYVLLARFFAACGLPEVAALAAPGIVLGALAIWAVAFTLRRHVGAAGSLAGAAVVALAPLAVLQGGLPNSDGAGFAALVLALCAAIAAAGEPAARETRAGWLPLAAGLLAGLALGIRPSYLPALVALPFLFGRGQRLRWCGGLALGIAAWLLPLAAHAGPGRFARIAFSFLEGHAGEWGGTIVVRPDLGERLGWLLFDVGAAGIGLPWAGAFDWPRVLLALLLAAGVAAAFASRAIGDGRVVLQAALLAAVPYAAWAFVGQNLIKARHALPLLAAAALLAALVPAALAARRAWLAPAFSGALALLLALVAQPLAAEQGGTDSPGMQLVRHVATELPPAGASYFTGEEARLFERYAPHYRAGRLAGGAELAAAASRLGAAGVQVYVSSTAPGFEGLRPQLQPVASFQTSRLVRAHANPVVLYRYLPAHAGGGDLP